MRSSQSGATDYTRTRAEVGRVTEVLLAALDGDDPRAVPWERIIEAQGQALMPLLMEMARMPFHPCVDGDLLPARPVEALATGVGAGVDLIVGDDRATRCACSSWRRLSPTSRCASGSIATSAGTHGRRRRLHRRSSGTIPMNVWAALFTDREMLLPALAVADAHQGRTLRYLFTWEVAPRADGLELRGLPRLGHPVSVRVARCPRLGGVVRGHRCPARLGARAQDAMQSAWAEFATTGDPGWAPVESGRVMVFGETCGEVDDPTAARAAVWR